jgi:hypothetical protein
MKRQRDKPHEINGLSGRAGNSTSSLLGGHQTPILQRILTLGGRGHRASPEEAGGPSAAGKVKNRMD